VVAAVDAEILAFARIAAQAELDLARIRSAKAATLNSLVAADYWQIAVSARGDEIRHLVAPRESGEPLFERSAAPATPRLPSSGRHADALRRSLTELLIVDRYEQRVTARRDRAVLLIIARYVLMTVVKSTNWRTQSDPVSREKCAINASGDCNWQNEPNMRRETGKE
jgi:hypothetical protein